MDGCLPLPLGNVSVGENGLSRFSYKQLAESELIAGAQKTLCL